MARNGYAQGKNSGHILTEREPRAKPSARKGVSYLIINCQVF